MDSRLEDRYIVIKRKGLTSDQLDDLFLHMRHNGIKKCGCVVIEEDWPEYDFVVQMIFDRINGI